MLIGSSLGICGAYQLAGFNTGSPGEDPVISLVDHNIFLVVDIFSYDNQVLWRKTYNLLFRA